MFHRFINTLVKGGLRALNRTFNYAGPTEYLWIEATRKCNCRCVACNIWKSSSAGAEITPDELETMLLDPLFRNLKVIVVSGGEPTLRSDLEALLCGIHRSAPNAGIVLSTNGSMPERLIDTIRHLLAAGTPISVGISLDGIGEKHDRTRGVDGLFEKIDRTLIDFKDLKLRYGDLFCSAVGYTLADSTIDEMESVRRYVEKTGFLFNVQWYNQADYYGNSGNNQLTRKTETLQIATALPPTMINETGLKWLRNQPIRFPCYSLFNFVILKSTGEMAPCFGLWNSVIGNIHEQTPSRIWKSAEAGIARSKVRRCNGCLNACGVVWSYESDFWPKILFNIRHPAMLFRKFT